MKRPAAATAPTVDGAQDVKKRPAVDVPLADKGSEEVKDVGKCESAVGGGVHLWLIRHGETENNVLSRQMSRELSGLDRLAFKLRYNQARASDPALSALGQEQVDRLPEHPALAPLLQSGRPVDVYTSPLCRAIETAAPLQNVLPESPPIRLRPDLSEIGGMHGCEDKRGKTPSELVQRFPNLSLDTSEINSNGWWAGRAAEDTTCSFGCRASWERVERVAAWIRQLRPSKEDGRDIAIVGHGALFNRLVPEILRMPRGSIQVAHGNVGVTHLELHGNHSTRVHCMNWLPLNSSPPDLLDTKVT